jgi:hypothetical protein
VAEVKQRQAFFRGMFWGAAILLAVGLVMLAAGAR